MEIPDALRVALSELAEEYPIAALARAASRLSAAYRVDQSSQANQADRGEQTDESSPSAAVGAPLDAAAYALTRLPATFAALVAALDAARLRRPDWRPMTLLDAGAGPGVAAWAARAVWPSLTRATLLERDQRMLALGQRLMRQAPAGCVVSWRQADLITEREPLSGAPFDLCIASYALNELPLAARRPLTLRLWRACGGALALVAPGTPAGFAAIREARAWLIAAGAQIIAPCPHADACPMPTGDWCHFAQRLARSRLHRRLKGGEAPFEDEKYSYVIASREPGEPFAARVIRHPAVHPGRIALDLCAPDGLMRAEITRSDAAWRAARQARWGSALASLPDNARER
ncbi:MAG TPA: small ribosomal subunit Rsm22 family protein [Ktedonobacterales bacterium]|nr:small ribosomal subunit Rsm22 family protein [Ktedonobacterales bacterium]